MIFFPLLKKKSESLEDNTRTGTCIHLLQIPPTKSSTLHSLTIFMSMKYSTLKAIAVANQILIF